MVLGRHPDELDGLSDDTLYDAGYLASRLITTALWDEDNDGEDNDDD